VARGYKLHLCTTAHRLATLLAVALVAGCVAQAPQPTSTLSRAPGQPLTHVVRPGETVYHIAHHYGVSVESLMEANHLGHARELRVGQSLTIPGAYGYASSGGSGSVSGSMWNVPRASRQFAWPLWAGSVTSGFGMRNGAMHDGVDIAAPTGTPVHAAGSGIVIFAGRAHGYGNTIIIRHSDNYVTVYAHNSANLVHQNQYVARAETIARVGTSGRTTGPNLHFEVRHDNVACDPLSYLSPPGPSPAVSFARGGAS